ncbi:MAG TPA: ribose-5-phosphate isomerase RpiA [Caulobacteraceae bacterium]|jgi:ribose 5-phosphate isomerase A|nr:ribose-5-phosphate isomerase RpiA [Caulobacteraceae bacterium]
MSPDEQKRAVGETAADLVRSGMIVGLGTGTTAAWLVRALAERRLDIRCVPTSDATATLAKQLGLTLIELDEAGEIDLTIDGADEIGPDLALIKGAGAALLREKLVWEASRRCVTIADASKVVPVLGGAFPLPIEVVAFGHLTTLRRIQGGLADCGILTAPRLRKKNGVPLVTDSGNLIYDASCGAILDPPSVEAALKSITGVVEHGLFLGLTKEALIGTDLGVERLGPRDLKELPNG